MPTTAIIACNVLEDEVRTLAAGNPSIRALIFLPQGLHNIPHHLNTLIRASIAEIEANHPSIDTIILVYGVCSRALENIPTTRCTLIVPRAHDCITLLLGSKERYQQQQNQNPATYWYSPGWNKQHAVPGPHRFEQLRQQLLKTHSPEDTDELLQIEKELHAHYTTAAYTDLGLSDPTANIAYTKTCALHMGWNFEHIPGDPALLRTLLNGPWDPARFLTVPPQHTIHLTIDDTIIKATPQQ